jgi:hypothetical protein
MLRFRSANKHSQDTHDSKFSVQTTIREILLPGRLNHTEVGIATKPSLYQCFRMFSQRYCSDERDRVYAALGLTGDDLAISPNYSLNLPEVLLQLSRETLLTGELTVLHHAGYDKHDPSNTQPSFIPRIRDDLSSGHARPLGREPTPRYSAGCLRQIFASLFGSTSISMPGVSVDDIVYTDFFTEVLGDLTIGLGSPLEPQLSDG